MQFQFVLSGSATLRVDVPGDVGACTVVVKAGDAWVLPSGSTERMYAGQDVSADFVVLEVWMSSAPTTE
jgi:hypothetical protein